MECGLEREKLVKLQTIKVFCGVAIAAGIVNFFAFAIIAACLGGDAVNGRSVGGHYFLSSHGKKTEVSEAVFNYSRIHVYSVWITHPLALLSGFILSSMTRQNRAGNDRPSTA
jgi:hypothetical protein